MLVALPLALTLLSSSGPRVQVTDSLVLSENFTSQFEFARVELEAGHVYRVEVRGAHQLLLEPIESGVQGARIHREFRSTDASRTITISVTAQVTAVYQLRASPMEVTGAPVRIYLDQGATSRFQKLAEPHQ